MAQYLTTRFNPLQTAQLDYILLDTSGSMNYGGKWRSLIPAIDHYLSLLKEQNLNSHVMLATFSDGPITIQRDEPLADSLPIQEYPPEADWGGTALYDAIHAMGLQLRDMDPPKCSILIVTDGEEADSRNTNLEQARAILEWMKAKGWQVTFMGCDFDNQKQTAKLGLDPRQAIGVRKGKLNAATDALAKKRGQYGMFGTDMHFSDDERTKFGGFLGGPSS